MSFAYIRFGNLDDEADGIEVLARWGPVSRYPERVYAVRETRLSSLDEAGISFRRLSDAELRNSAAPVASKTR